MRFSKFNIFSQIKNSDKYFILNQLSGNADILSSQEAQAVKEYLTNQNTSFELYAEFIEKGYICDEKTEDKNYKLKYLDFIDNREKDEVQLFFVPNYSCNFACSYCYQDEYYYEKNNYDLKVIDAFFDYITTHFTNRKKYITIFGGEPLINSLLQKELIKYLLDKSNLHNLDVCIVTNGYTITEYIDLLKKYNIREIQVTLDGTSSIHNKRRTLKNGLQTFDKIVEGIDACLLNNIPVNLRIVIDNENIDNLPELAKFAINKGWTASENFKTQIGRNYELHHCQSSPEKLFSRISLYEKIYELLKENEFITEFYKPSFSISKYISENEELPSALFDSCPACKSEWAFDYTGKIYSCTATVGKSDEALGTFYPVINLNSDQIEKWENRDVTTIDKCRNCNLQFACGGGCGSVAKNKNGNILSSDCRPIKELLELGFSHYFNDR